MILGGYKAPASGAWGRRFKSYRPDQCKEAIKRLESKKITAPESIFGNLIYSATNKEQNLIVERYLGFFNDVRSIINSNDQPEDVFVLNIQMIPVCRT